ncbi:hypothetical protein [Streptomyces sp. cg35]|uniref:hypothetical protein n=1 Tax=Streptomyces sp. cg35 TaxID=3421650 RepID=UPI003D18535D
MGCCGGGGGYRVGQWNSGETPPKGAKVWRHRLPEGETFDDGKNTRDFVTWVEADASRAAAGGRGEYFQAVAEG